MKTWMRELAAVWPLLAMLVGLGGFVWLIHNPESAVVEWARQRPLLAPAARGLRARWGPRPEAAVPQPSLAKRAASEGEAAPRVELILPEIRPRVWAESGTPVYSRPEPGGEVARRLATTRSLPYTARRGEWFQVRLAGSEGWIELPGYDEVTNPPLGSGRRVPVAGPGRSPDPELLAAAEELLQSPVRHGELGPYALLTDVEDKALLARLSRLAGNVETAFRRRFGLSPRAATVSTVVLFRREADYRRFQALTPQVAGLASSGHAGGGLVALFAETDGAREVEDALVHELTHDVTRRAVGPALPAWLAEGLADELAHSRWDEEGRWLAGTWSGEERLVERRREEFDTEEGRGVRIEERYTVTGGRASLLSAQEAVTDGRLPSLEALTGLEWRQFVRDGMTLHYAESFLFIRYLLADPRHAPRFRTFLAAVADGAPADGEVLREQLGMSWAALGAAFRSWIVEQSPQDQGTGAAGSPARTPSGSSSRHARVPSA